MKKNYKAFFYGKFANGTSDMVAPRNNAISPSHFPLRGSGGKKYPKPNLHKIGGMEKEVHRFVSSYVNLSDKETVILRTRSIDTVRHLAGDLNAIVNLKKTNDIRRINKFFEEVNLHSKPDALFLGCVETSELRQARFKKIFPGKLAVLLYFFDFIFRRIFPKLELTKGLYFLLTDGKNRVMSKAEILGRLICCGFDIVELRQIRHVLYFVVKKVKDPSYDLKPSYGPLFKMRRVGQNGKIIQVYKFRTMHPYSEYLQDYIIRTNGYKDMGKPADDFRITSWGRFLRKYWLDELPQLINIMRGEMKLVGIRPISNRFLNEFPEKHKEERLKQKPGCVPPYMSLLRQSVQGFIEAEMIYLEEKSRRPYTTDIKYLCKALYNVLTNKIRSA